MAKVEGLWHANRPRCLVPRHPDDSPEVQSCSPLIVPSLFSMRDPHDIILGCHDHLLSSSSGKTTVHVHWNCQCSSAHLWHPHWNPKYYESSKPLCLFPNPFSMPVTLSLRYFGAPSYQSLIY